MIDDLPTERSPNKTILSLRQFEFNSSGSNEAIQ
jgi:hypothetical protein